jgi:hypothetical protein
MLGWKGLSGTNTLAFWAPFVSYKENNCCEYSPSAIYITLQFLPNFKMDQISYSMPMALDWKGLQVTNTLAYWALFVS